jgi:predicted acetyltransferase
MDLAHDEDFAELAPLLAWSFCFPATDVEPWVRRAGIQNVRVERRAGRVEACLLRLPMGQFFSGRSVPMVGIAGVATPPETRGSGAAIALMTSALEELHDEGVALSVLYPATLGLYRRAGYECAGGRYEVSLKPSAIGVRDHALPCRAMAPEDEPAVERLYRAVAARSDGHLDRGPYVWQRVRSPRGADLVRGFVVGEEGHVEGYARLYEKKQPSGYFSLHASDLVAQTPAAHRRLLALLADHGTTAEIVKWNGAPADPFLQLVQHVNTEVRLLDPWMLRVTHVKAALERRGWSAGIDAEIEIDVVDDVVAANAGRWTLRVAGGRAEVARGGRGGVRVDVRALAAMYSGFLTPRAAAASGGVEGSDDEIERMAAVFQGGAPWMPDYF